MKPWTERRSLRMHSLRPVPRTTTSIILFIQWKMETKNEFWENEKRENERNNENEYGKIKRGM